MSSTRLKSYRSNILIKVSAPKTVRRCCSNRKLYSFKLVCTFWTQRQQRSLLFVERKRIYKLVFSTLGIASEPYHCDWAEYKLNCRVCQHNRWDNIPTAR